MLIYVTTIKWCACAKFDKHQFFAWRKFSLFANLDFARNFPPAKIISTANGISRNFPRREIFLAAKIKF